MGTGTKNRIGLRQFYQMGLKLKRVGAQNLDRNERRFLKSYGRRRVTWLHAK
jgi:hypothetical protein